MYAQHSYIIDTWYFERHYQNTNWFGCNRQKIIHKSIDISYSLFRSQPAFHGFVSAIVADGGGDTPEDIMGALKVAFTSLSWRSEGSKVYQ